MSTPDIFPVAVLVRVKLSPSTNRIFDDILIMNFETVIIAVWMLQFLPLARSILWSWVHWANFIVPHAGLWK